jgi:hypothetical protein
VGRLYGVEDRGVFVEVFAIKLAHRTGHPQSAAALLELADAAKNAWLWAEGERSYC